MKKFFQFTALFLAACLCFTNCATIVSKTSYPVSIETSPSGAQVSITDKKGKEIYRGKTPAAMKLKSGAGFFSRAEYQVKLSARGYEERVIPITFKLNGWYFGNILFGGLLGMLIIDPASGAMWRIDKKSGDISETLSSTSTSSIKEPALKIMDIKDVPQSLRSNLVRIN